MRMSLVKFLQDFFGKCRMCFLNRGVLTFISTTTKRHDKLTSKGFIPVLNCSPKASSKGFMASSTVISLGLSLVSNDFCRILLTSFVRDVTDLSLRPHGIM
jgi:hypothetical protein